MHLKKLQLNGFKSFADKTTLKFEPGITAVVGPNGCGKSNIADAIQWVLGEQSPRALRVHRLEDLVFNGTMSRSPQGYAQVSLTIENPEYKREKEKAVPKTTSVGNGFAVPTHMELKNGDGKSVMVSDAALYWKGLPEITVTRRYYRSGESEYYINKQPVRLKDITDLFLDTGLGGNAYSLMEKEKVELVLTGKPEDRRFLFEEAAGIMKYRVSKIESTRKLEETQLNILRVNDIMSEVKRSINAIRRQVSRAERYKKYKAELRSLDINLLLFEMNRLNEEWKSIRQELDSARQNEEKFKASFSATEEKIEKLRRELMDREEELREHRAQYYEFISSRERANSQVSILQERRKNLSEREKEVLEELERIECRIQELEKEYRDIGAGFRNIEKEIEKLQIHIQKGEAELKDVESRLKEAKEKEKDSICLCCTVCIWRKDRDNEGCFLHGKRFKEAKAAGKDVPASANSIYEEVRRLEDAREELIKRINEDRISLASLTERLSAGKSEEARLEKDRKELLRIRDGLKKEIAQIPEASEGIESELKEVKVQIERLLRDTESKKAEIQKYEDAYIKARDILAREEDSLKEMRRARGNEERLKELEIRDIQYKLKIENIAQKLKENYYDAGVENIVLPEDFNPEDARRQAGILRQRIEGMGEVNLVAPEEYQRLKERYLFLKKQTEDLTKSEADLKKVIEEIEKTCKERFMGAFNKIKENFENIYTRLFEGGEATLSLTDPDNPLETGIEIVAQPPGKKLQNILLLSDGERALTAIALLFAIFLVKPSPFCFLDEIDAPLDDANIMRFTKLLKEFSRLSQFIVITHNKRTMESANILYGITMEEQGVSKVISVKMGEPVPA